MNTLPLSTIYRGQRSGRSGQTVVMAGANGVLNRVLTPGPSLQLYKHSLTGFEWGYGGSGPAQLALAILLDFTRSPTLAKLLYQRFKRDYVCGWDLPGFSITGAEIGAWLMQMQELFPCISDEDFTLPDSSRVTRDGSALLDESQS